MTSDTVPDCPGRTSPLRGLYPLTRPVGKALNGERDKLEFGEVEE